MITHPTVLTIDAEARQFAEQHHRPSAPLETDSPVEARRRHGMPRAIIAGLRSLAQRAAHGPRPAATPR